jgi:hypothetical protein
MPANNLRVSKKTQKKLKSAVNNIKQEVFGNLNLNSNNKLVATTMFRGDAENTGDILPNDSSTYYTYHTHPKSIYKTKNFRVAWPSMQDIEMIFFMINRRDPSQIMHVLFTVEGLYYIDFPPENYEKAKRIAKRLGKCKKFPCCNSNDKTKETLKDFCFSFNQDRLRNKDKIRSYISRAISHGTIRIRFERWSC